MFMQNFKFATTMICILRSTISIIYIQKKQYIHKLNNLELNNLRAIELNIELIKHEEVSYIECLQPEFQT